MKNAIKKIIAAFIYYLIAGCSLALAWYLVSATAHGLGFEAWAILKEGNMTKFVIYLATVSTVGVALTHALEKLIYGVIDFITHSRIIRQFFSGSLFWGGVIALGWALFSLIAAAFGVDIKGAAC